MDGQRYESEALVIHCERARGKIITQRANYRLRKKSIRVWGAPLSL